MVEFIFYNNESTSTKFFPFFACKILNPCISFDILELSDVSTCERIFKQKILDIYGDM